MTLLHRLSDRMERAEKALNFIVPVDGVEYLAVIEPETENTAKLSLTIEVAVDRLDSYQLQHIGGVVRDLLRKEIKRLEALK